MGIPKINPFNPNSPVHPGMFSGRLTEIEKLEATLLQTGSGNPANFLITGERGIGKTSFMNYIKWLADGSISLKGYRFNFVVINTDVDQKTTQFGLVKKIQLGINKQIESTDKFKGVLNKAWEFIKRIEANGFSVKDRCVENEVFLEEFAYSLADIVKKLTDPDLGDAKYQGFLLLIDEADKASDDLGLGGFIKLLLERIQRNGCHKFMVGLVGLNELRDVLYKSHPSSLRIFEDIQLDRLSSSDVSSVIDNCLTKAIQDNGFDIKIPDDGKAALIGLSEGYPHFIQQFGFNAFSIDSDNLIDKDDVYNGAFGNGGALEIIGDRYYKNDFYNKIKKDSYRQVLRIMAENLDSWVTKAQIKTHFKGTDAILNNAISALRTRHIIISKEGKLGTYRLQHKGFALWIKLYTAAPKELESQGTTN